MNIRLNERRAPLVDWDAIDAMFRYVESAQCPERTLSGFAVSGFVAAAVIVDAAGDPGAWWQTLLGRSPASAPEQMRRGFVENWRDVEAGFKRGKFAPVVSGPDERDHRRTVAEFCAGFLRALDARRGALAEIGDRPAVREAVRTLRHHAAVPGARARAQIAEALQTLWSAAGNVRAEIPEAAPLRAA